MTNKTEQTLIDKSDWLDGPWKNEPDIVSWIDPSTGYNCLVRRAVPELGNLCGYVAVDKDHPLYGKRWTTDSEVYALNAHGGITHTDYIPEEDTEFLWWIGFDCAHADDLSPGLHKLLMESKMPGTLSWQVYRDMDYVISEVESLAKQIKEKEVEDL